MTKRTQLPRSRARRKPADRPYTVEELHELHQAASYKRYIERVRGFNAGLRGVGFTLAGEAIEGALRQIGTAPALL